MDETDGPSRVERRWASVAAPRSESLLVILLSAGVAVMARRPWWRVLAFIGVLVSQATIFVWWDDAATGTVANLLIIAAVVLARPMGLAFGAAAGAG